MLLYRVSWRGWSGTFSQVRLKLNFKPRLKYWKKNFETIEICQAYHHWRKTYSFVNIDLQYRTTAKLVFHQILAVFFRIMANCIHLVFYRFLSLKCKLFYHFSYSIQTWHFVELFLLSGVISTNPILEDKILYEEPKNVSNLSTPSSFEKNIVIRKYWFPITTAKLVFHQIITVFFFNVATCFHLVFYRLFSFKCKFSYHFSYVIQIWHFIELLLLSGVIPANLF